jgi:hypothetical protein
MRHLTEAVSKTELYSVGLHPDWTHWTLNNESGKKQPNRFLGADWLPHAATSLLPGRPGKSSRLGLQLQLQEGTFTSQLKATF